MSQKVFPWPVLDAEGEKIETRIDWSFHTLDSDGEYQLESNESSRGCSLTHGRGWHPDSHDLIARCTISVNSGMLAEANYAQRKSKVGLALKWKSGAPGRIQGCGEKVEVTVDEGECTADLEVTVPRASAAGSVGFVPVVFLVALPEQRIEHVQTFSANLSGSLLGELDGLAKWVFFDGEGSSFSVEEVAAGKNKSPWWIILDWEDPIVDELDDRTISILVNSEHALFPEIKGGDSERPFQTEIMNGIMAEALGMLLLKLRASSGVWEQIVSGDNLEVGSVGGFANYYLRTYQNLQQALEAPERLLQELREIVQSRRQNVT